MINRREFLESPLGAGAALALTPELLRALQQSGGKLIQRAIPSTGEMLPVIGLSFSNHAACADPAALKEVLKTLVDNGGRVFDAMHGNAAAEQFHATVANELGVQNKLFWSTRGTPPRPRRPAAARRRHRESAHRDVVGEAQGAQDRPGHAAARGRPDAPRRPEGGEEGGARPVHRRAGDRRQPVYPQLEAVMRNEPIDFIGVDYDIEQSRASRTRSCRSPWSGRSA